MTLTLFGFLLPANAEEKCSVVSAAKVHVATFTHGTYMMVTDPTTLHLCISGTDLTAEDRKLISIFPRGKESSICSTIESARYFTEGLLARASEYNSLINTALARKESVKICLYSEKVVQADRAN